MGPPHGLALRFRPPAQIGYVNIICTHILRLENKIALEYINRNYVRVIFRVGTLWKKTKTVILCLKPNFTSATKIQIRMRDDANQEPEYSILGINVVFVACEFNFARLQILAGVQLRTQEKISFIYPQFIIIFG